MNYKDGYNKYLSAQSGLNNKFFAGANAKQFWFKL